MTKTHVQGSPEQMAPFNFTQDCPDDILSNLPLPVQDPHVNTPSASFKGFQRDLICRALQRNDDLEMENDLLEGVKRFSAAQGAGSRTEPKSHTVMDYTEAFGSRPTNQTHQLKEHLERQRRMFQVMHTQHEQPTKE